VIVATAGHIDHGKTRLVKALTGVDTDRLPEERARGISIDIGFAHVDLGGDARVSFIDVPGHEKFIRNMLAGVSAIDAALLVVAADDGVMPQTSEHLHILDLLDVRRGAAVITKTDVVAPERVEEVKAQVQDALATTSLASASIFPVSAATGEGLPALREWLAALTAGEAKAGDDGRHFRLSVDRAFTVAGSGTVVTGTVLRGTVSVGDHLVVSPSGREVRVRALRVQDMPATRASFAQRCALNLSGVSVEDVGRGDWIVDAAVHAPSRRIDARLKVLAGEDTALAHWTPVHLHVGTADVPARIAISGEASIAPGASGFVQLVLERPVAALRGDRFVVRDQSARRTLGGGVVLDPFAPKRQRRAQLRVAELQVLEQALATDVLAGLLEITESGVDIGTACRNLDLTPDRAAAALREANAVVLGKEHPVGITRAAADLLLAKIFSAAKTFHAAHPQESGIDIPALRRATGTHLPPPAFQAFVRELANRQQIVLSNDLVRLREHEATSNPQDEQLWDRVQRLLAKCGVHVPLVAELAQRLDVPPQTLRDFLHRKSRTGEILRVTPERFALRETLACIAATCVDIARRSDDGFFAAAQLRDVIGTGRGLAIHYLEFFDRLGITQRFGDRRRVGKDFTLQLGAGEPLPPTNKETS
jgi:selenocysteine-specific elongation factor